MSNEYLKKYPSGLRLAVKEMKGFYSVCVGVMVGVGSRMETPEENGYSHFIEHMSFKGTTQRTALKISQEIDVTGGNINAYTSKDTTCFYTKTGSKDVGLCFDILADMLFDSLFSQKEIETERKVILEEISIDEDSPEEVCHDLLSQALFGKCGLGQTITGSVENVDSASREGLLDFKKKHYTPDNIIISVAGNVCFDDIDQLVQRFFECRFPSNEGVSPKKDAICDDKKILLPSFCANSLYKIKNDVEQSHISLGFPTKGIDDATYYPTVIAANILGGGMSSRLFQTLREKYGLAYSVYSFPSLYSDCGYMEVYCGTNPQRAEEAYNLLCQQLFDFCDKGATKEEFDINKSQFSGGNRLAMESTMSVMRAQGNFLLRTGKLIDIEDRIAQVDKVTFDSVFQAIKDIFNCLPAKAYVGKKIDNLEKII